MSLPAIIVDPKPMPTQPLVFPIMVMVMFSELAVQLYRTVPAGFCQLEPLVPFPDALFPPGLPDVELFPPVFPPPEVEFTLAKKLTVVDPEA